MPHFMPSLQLFFFLMQSSNARTDYGFLIGGSALVGANLIKVTDVGVTFTLFLRGSHE